MLSFAIFATSVVVGLIGVVIYFFLTKKSPSPTKIPGPPIVDKNDGNLPELREAETLHNYVADLHDTYGPIVGFFLGPQYVISIGSAELFEEHAALFDRPGVLFEPLEPLITHSSIQFTNGREGKRRHGLYSHYFSGTRKFYPEFLECTRRTVDKLNGFPKDHYIPLNQTMFELSTANICKTAFGGVFTTTEESDLIQMYDSWILDVERKFSGKEGDSTYSGLDVNKRVQSLVKEGMDRRIAQGDVSDVRCIDIILNDTELSEEAKLADAVTVLFGGIHTTANLLTWCIYFLADHQDYQQKLVEEIDGRLTAEDITADQIDSLPFLQQIVSESLRLSCVGTMAARYSEDPSVLGGYDVPPNTPVIHALAYVLQSDKYFEDADQFIPSRFAKENCGNLHSYANKPFGFAGNRTCLGNRFALHETYVALAMIFRSLTVDLVADQTVTPYYGFVTRPTEEVWITVSPRLLDN